MAVIPGGQQGHLFKPMDGRSEESTSELLLTWYNQTQSERMAHK